jgi:hypothetical protein
MGIKLIKDDIRTVEASAKEKKGFGKKSFLIQKLCAIDSCILQLKREAGNSRRYFSVPADMHILPKIGIFVRIEMLKI